MPDSRIDMRSSENAGKLLDLDLDLDLDAELGLWTRAGHLTIELGEQIDIRRLDKLIARAVLHAG